MRTKTLLLLIASTTALCACSPAPSPHAPSPSPADVSTSQMSDPAHGDDVEAHLDDLHHDEAPALPQWSDSAQVDVLARAEGFVRAWARPDLTTSDWFAGISGYLTPAAAEGFMWTDPAYVPATTVTGPSQLVGEGTGTSATVAVPTDAGELHVLLINSGEHSSWQVASVSAPEQQGDL